MTESHDKAVSVLNDLIETCRDGENGFRKAAESVHDSGLKALFNRFSAQRQQFAQDLQAEVAFLGGKPQGSGSAAAAVHRGWMNIKRSITADDDASIIAECERGEDVAKASYRKALEKELPANLRTKIQAQYLQVQDAHDQVRALEIQTSGS